ncbi:MAG: hypothetical protein U5N26_01070 [Candidatus Marinimicrobia bacterium]|nr:hypothetical protein [Candidatus Neomarinimicrobiota bacterium]
MSLHRETELKVLSSQGFREKIAEENIKLSTYGIEYENKQRKGE